MEEPQMKPSLRSDNRRNFIAAGAGLGAGLMLPGLAAAQPVSLPKTIRIVVPFSPGASNDLFARALAQRLGPKLGLNAIVENKPGAGGRIGAELVARGETDGSVLLFSSNSFTTGAALTPKLPYDMEKSFAPVALMARSPMILLVAANSPLKNVADVVAAARRDGPKMTFGSSGVGGLNHMATELFQYVAKIDTTHVPYKGMAGAVTDLIAGNIQYLISTSASAGAQVRNGQLRALGVSSTDRSRFMPELPPIAETLPGYGIEGWWGVYAPGGTPAPIVATLNKVIREVNREPEIEQLLARETAVSSEMDPAAFRKFYLDELNQWKKLVAERNLMGK
jgi:tripartite-type tricarboxylate transporter receptor subunit TctC